MKILLIDDDEIFLQTVTYYLSKHYEVLTATNGRDGLRLIREAENIDCLVVDYMMPCINGLDIAKIVHSTPNTSTRRTFSATPMTRACTTRPS